jgi:hypothetical protein
MQVHLSRTKRKYSVHQAVRRRLDTPRVPERHGRKALQARHEHGKRKPRLPLDDEALCAKLEIARARHLSRLAQACAAAEAERSDTCWPPWSNVAQQTRSSKASIPKFKPTLRASLLSVSLRSEAEAALCRHIEAFLASPNLPIPADVTIDRADGFTYERRNIEQHIETQRHRERWEWLGGWGVRTLVGRNFGAVPEWKMPTLAVCGGGG